MPVDKSPRRGLFNRIRSRENKKQVRRSMDSMVNNIDASMKALYGDTYLSDRSNLDNLGFISDKMEDNINAIIKRNNKYDISNTSKLYTRLMTKNSSNEIKNEGKLSSEIESLFGDSQFTDAILGSYLSNKWIADFDKEIDTILKMLPDLKEALDVLKDAVLSADSVSKEFIYPKVAISDNIEQKLVIDRISKLSEKYGLSNKVEDWYDNASHYGEQFVYQVPYSKAIEKLLITKKQSGNSNVSIPMIENGIINESTLHISGNAQLKDFKLDKACSLDVKIDTSRMLISCIENSKIANDVYRYSPRGLMESYYDDLKNGITIHEKTKFDKVIADDLDIPDGLNPRTYKGTGLKGDGSTSVDVRGCVIKSLDRHNLIRLYVDDICLGYYYLEFTNKNDLEMNYHMDSDRNLGYSKSISTIEKTITDNLQDTRVDHLMKLISKQMSDKLDATFVNANQDLTKEIYAILKYNDVFNSNVSVRVSFLPPEDVKWLRFREDSDLHIGISDVNDSLYPAKLLAMLYTTFVTGTLTRGQDKRVYYVKQTIETNIAQTLLNVINQIKKSNFNMRSIENLNNLLNITGRFNDYIIPVGPSGDSPIQFEIMPGQQFEINQDLFNMLQEMTINPIAPLELIQARMNPDFATAYTTSSLKLLRKTYRRQARLEMFISSIFTDAYAAEYGEYIDIDCELPPPVFLSMVNTNQLLDNAKTYAELLAELEYADDQSETVDIEKAIFTRKLIRAQLGTYIRPSEIERHKEAAKFEAQRRKQPEPPEE